MVKKTDCKHRMKIEQFNYYPHGCDHKEMGGFACLAFINEDTVVWMTGVDGCMCECYKSRNEHGDCDGCKHLVEYDDGFGCSAQHEMYDDDVCPIKDGEEE